MELYIIRHGQTELNLRHVLQGRLDSPLTETGRLGAQKIAEALKDTPFDRVYTSNLNRAIATTEIILAGRDEEIIQDSRVGEMSFGPWQGKTQDEICTTKEIEENYIAYFKHPERYQPPEDGEGFESLLDRARSFLDTLEEYRKAEQAERVLLVSHGAMIKAIIAVIQNRSIADFWEPPYVTNCSLTIVEFTDEGIFIRTEATTDHLGEHTVPMTETGYLK